MEGFPRVEEEMVRKCLAKINLHESMDPNGIDPHVLRELAEVTAEPHSITCERSWRTGDVPEHWRRASVTPVFKKNKKGP